MSRPRADRAVSEVIGFTLVFALVLSMVALVSVAGFSDLDNVRENEQVNNAERAFDVVADNVADLALRGAPSRATEMRLTEASLRTGDAITINVTGITPGGRRFTIGDSRVRPLIYEGGDGTQIIYSSGAVFRVQRQGGLIVREPPFVLEPDRVHLPLVLTQSRQTESVGGGTVRIQTRVAERELAGFDSRGRFSDLTINVTSPRYELWAEYLESEEAIDDCTLDQDRNSAVCDIVPGGAPDRLAVQIVRVDVEFDR